MSSSSYIKSITRDCLQRKIYYFYCKQSIVTAPMTVPPSPHYKQQNNSGLRCGVVCRGDPWSLLMFRLQTPTDKYLLQQREKSLSGLRSDTDSPSVSTTEDMNTNFSLQEDCRYFKGRNVGEYNVEHFSNFTFYISKSPKKIRKFFLTFYILTFFGGNIYKFSLK